MRIAIFGGSFDPPHNGHFQLLNQALYLVDEVWLIPVFIPPLKIKEQPCKSFAEAKDRLNMCNLLVQNIKNAKVLDLEILRKGKSYSIDTVREIKQKNPLNKFYFLIGSDWIPNLTKWYKAEELFKEIEFISLPRTDISSSKIREKIKRGESIDELVPKEINNYIRKNKLYL